MLAVITPKSGGDGWEPKPPRTVILAVRPGCARSSQRAARQMRHGPEPTLTSTNSLRGASGKWDVFEAEFPAEGQRALLNVHGFSRTAQRPQRLRPVVQCAGKRRPCFHLLEEPDGLLKV